MAMLECPGCKRIVDDSVKLCPNCKFNVKKHVKEMAKAAKKNGGKSATIGSIALSSVYNAEPVSMINVPKLDFLSQKNDEGNVAETPLFESPSLNAKSNNVASVNTQPQQEYIFETPSLNAPKEVAETVGYEAQPSYEESEYDNTYGETNYAEAPAYEQPYQQDPSYAPEQAYVQESAYEQETSYAQDSAYGAYASQEPVSVETSQGAQEYIFETPSLNKPRTDGPVRSAAGAAPLLLTGKKEEPAVSSLGFSGLPSTNGESIFESPSLNAQYNSAPQVNAEPQQESIFESPSLNAQYNSAPQVNAEPQQEYIFESPSLNKPKNVEPMPQEPTVPTGYGAGNPALGQSNPMLSSAGLSGGYSSPAVTPVAQQSSLYSGNPLLGGASAQVPQPQQAPAFSPMYGGLGQSSSYGNSGYGNSSYGNSSYGNSYGNNSYGNQENNSGNSQSPLTSSNPLLGHNPLLGGSR